MLVNDEVRVLVNDLRQAMQLERKYHYTDLKGRAKTFSKFLLDTLGLLRPFLKGKNKPEDLEQLLTAVKHYPHGDLAYRMRLLDKVQLVLNPDEAKPQKPKVAKPIHPLDPTQASIGLVKGLSAQVAQILRRSGINTVYELVYTFPKRYLDYQETTPIATVEDGQEVMISGVIQSSNLFQPKGKKLSFLTVVVKDDSGSIPLVWVFAQAKREMLFSMKNRYTVGLEVLVTGKVKHDSYRKRLVIASPDVEIMSGAETTAGQESIHRGRIVPIYPLTDGLSHKMLRRCVFQALEQFEEGFQDPIPLEYRSQYALMNLQQAIRQIHFPDTVLQAENARQRLVFDEFLSLQLRLALTREQYRQLGGGTIMTQRPDGLVERFLNNLPFSLTKAQQRVLLEIKADMQSQLAMYRLLQGDVGSGKTIIALLAILLGVENGFQGALMAPTEILAEQHYRNFVNWLTPLGLKVGLFVGKTGSKLRKELRQSLLNGQIHVAVGTHALFQEEVQFANLGVIVVDEQHRFGVRQRLMLKSKGDNPEMLTMSATPIPRTLAMSVHGDMDVSVLDELPPGRTPIKTALYHSQKGRQAAYQLIKHQVVLGHQAYVVYPLIEESETLSAKAATDAFEQLKTEVFPELRIGLMHGKLRPEERDAVMEQFLQHQLDILVCTTVVEVGVDVPNATVMMIENAERFGLSQLHQLRGRVGRSSFQSYCVLMSDSKGEDALKRLGILVESEDGFYIAEKDLEIRGPGEFLGTRQSGLPQFLLANLVLDQPLLELAKEVAAQMIKDDPGLMHQVELAEWVAKGQDQQSQVLTSG